MANNVFQTNDEFLLEKWAELEDVPFTESESPSGQALENDWWIFKKGDDRAIIWKYFNIHYSKGVFNLLYGEPELRNPAKPFSDALLSGEATANDIDDYVDYWHSNKTGKSLKDFLGVTDEEYLFFLKTGDDEVLASSILKRKAPVIHRHTFFLHQDEYNQVNDYLLGNVEIPMDCAEQCPDDLSCGFKVYSKRAVTQNATIGLELHYTQQKKFCVVFTVYENGIRKTLGRFSFSLTERFVVHHDGRSYDIGVDVVPDHWSACEMFDQGIKLDKCQKVPANVCTTLAWARGSVNGIAATWITQQRAIYIYNKQELWYTFDGVIWELFEWEPGSQNHEITVYRNQK